MEEREHRRELLVERETRMRQTMLGCDRAHRVEAHAALHLPNLAKLVVHAQPLKGHLLPQ